MKRIYTLTIVLLLFCFNISFSQTLSNEAMNLAKTGLNCIDNNDYYCGMINLEQLLNIHISEMNYEQKTAVKSELINCYYEVSMAKGQKDDPNFKSYCLKGIKLGKEINQQYDLNAFMLHYMMIAHYCFLENKSQMYNWINKFNVIKENLNVDNKELKSEMIKWSNNNIRIMKNTFNSSASSTTTYSFSFGDLISESSSSTNKAMTTYNKNTTKKVVKKIEKCCDDTKLGDKVIIYWAHTNKGEKISLYYYPHLDKWHFKNGWGETFRGNKFYNSLDEIIEVIENE